MARPPFPGGIAFALVVVAAAAATPSGCSEDESAERAGTQTGSGGTAGASGAGGRGGATIGGGGAGASGAHAGSGGTAGGAGASGGSGGAGDAGSGGAAGAGGAGGGATTCSSCHGSAASSAPPADTQGQTSTTLPTVGAHQAHGSGDPSYFRPVACGDCHIVPADVAQPGHLDPAPAETIWSALAQAGGVAASYDGQSCTVYCHGASLAGGQVAAPVWTVLDGSQLFCGSCHGVPPPAPHPSVGLACGPCHAFTGLAPNDPTTHVDGKVDVVPCGGCHGVPPPTGSHVAHYGDTSLPPLVSYGDLRTVAAIVPGGAPYYAFGCGNCHPLSASAHGDGGVQVELFDPTAPAGTLKARNAPTATFAAGTCSGVYCHSSGQQTPAYVATPAWNGGSLPEPRCAACHANPPAYPSGGASTPSANTHVVIGDDGWELGHFGGLPGPWHGSWHGEGPVDSAPITCQTCHYATVDSSHTGPGGLYYLDTSGDYDLGGMLGYSCAACHTGGAGEPAVGAGAVVTARHVDGARDVAFDPRTSVPASATGLPPAPNRPTLPYWTTEVPGVLPPSSAVDGTTWSFHLADASYDPVDKTCSSVPCHLRQSYPASKPQWAPLRWGVTPAGMATCDACHQF